MFPVSDVIPSRRVPVVTIALILLNTVVFAVELALDDRALPRVVQRFGVVPGALSWSALLTGMFLHVGWLQFLGNMLYLWIFGDNVENRMGRGKYLLFYLACGVGSALWHTATSPHSTAPLIGASGAIAGVIGTYFVLFPRSRILTAVFLVLFLDLVEIPAIMYLGIWFMLQFASGVGSLGAQTTDPAAAFWAQVAGFLCGAGIGLLRRLAAIHRRQEWEY